MSNYSTVRLRTPDRQSYYTFTGSEVIITGLDNMYGMPERNKTIHTVYGRDGGFETIGGFKPKTISMNIDIIVDEHEDVYTVLESLHALLSYQYLELYFDPPKRYVKVSYRRGSLTEQLGYGGVYIRGTIDFDIIDPFWYSEIPKMVTNSTHSISTNGSISNGNYFYSYDYVLEYSGFIESDIGRILNISAGNNEGYYEIIGVLNSGCFVSTETNLIPEEDLDFIVYNPPKISKELTSRLLYSGQDDSEAYMLVTDDLLKTYTDHVRVRSYFDGTITVDSDKLMFTSGLSEIPFEFDTYPTIDLLVSGINEYATSGDYLPFTMEYTNSTEFRPFYIRQQWSPSGFYGLAYEPNNSGEWTSLKLEDKTFFKTEYETLGEISGVIKDWNDLGDYTYTFSGIWGNFYLQSTESLIDTFDTDFGDTGGLLYNKDYLTYRKSTNTIPVAGNYKIFPLIQVINRGSIPLDGFDIIRYASGSVEEGRISYFDILEENKLLEIDTLNKTVLEYDVDLLNKDDYINNVYTNKINKTTTITDFISLENDDEMYLIIDTDSDNDVDADFLFKWTDRYL